MAQSELDPEIHRLLDRFRGQLAGFIEACSLPERQERAMVTHMKDLSYQLEKSLNEKEST